MLTSGFVAQDKTRVFYLLMPQDIQMDQRQWRQCYPGKQLLQNPCMMLCFYVVDFCVLWISGLWPDFYSLDLLFWFDAWTLEYLCFDLGLCLDYASCLRCLPGPGNVRGRRQQQRKESLASMPVSWHPKATVWPLCETKFWTTWTTGPIQQDYPYVECTTRLGDGQRVVPL